MGDDARRKLSPRTRNHRAIRDSQAENAERRVPLPVPVEDNGKWLIEGGIASRLQQKSAIGKTLPNGVLSLSPAEVMFCHWHRHLPLPSDDWIEQQMELDENFMHIAAAHEAGRDGGEKIVLLESLKDDDTASVAEGTWALRWNRNQHPSRDAAQAQVRCHISSENIDWQEMLEWTMSVNQNGHEAEVFVVDGEFDVTFYRLSITDLRGNMDYHKFSSDLSTELKDAMQISTRTKDGYFVPIAKENWRIPTIGVAQMNGMWLNLDEGSWLENELGLTQESPNALFSDLIARGLLCRPGFKYGCRWRIYAEDIDQAHAPWLLSPLNEAAANWDGACLSVRLAAGVHKKWLCAIGGEKWNYLSLERIVIGRD